MGTEMETRISSTNFIYDGSEELTGVNVSFTSHSMTAYISGNVTLTPEEFDKHGVKQMKKAVTEELGRMYGNEEDV